MKKILLSLCVIAGTCAWAQDSCDTAVSISAGTHTVDAVNGAATTLNCSGGSGDGNAAEWYSYTTGDSSELFNLSTNLEQNAGGDTRVHLYSGSCDTLECAGGADDVDNTNYLSELEILLDANTTYYIAFDDRWNADGFDFEISTEPYSIDCSITLPFTENFDDALKFTSCYTVEDVDGNGSAWISQQNLDLDGDGINETFATNGANDGPENDYLISPSMALEAGNTYNLTAHFNASDSQTTPANESLEILILDGPSSTANVIATLASQTGITPNGSFAELESQAYEVNSSFTPDSSGTYYIAFHITSPGANAFLLLFDYNITENLSVNDVDLTNTTSVYPNPAKDMVNIKLSEDFDAAKTTVTLTSVTGKKAAQFANVNEVNVSNLAAGVYVMTITDGKKTETKKLIKK